MEDTQKKLYLADGSFIAYHQLDGKKNYPGVIFMGGFMSDMNGIKATSLQKFCHSNGYPFIRFDYSGHGKSSKDFTECAISTWKQNVLDVLDKLSTGTQILIGSSMGGWLMLLAALDRPERVAALIGIASAPDFTEDLIWDKITGQEKEELRSQGILYLKSEYGETPYPITMRLIEDGRKHLLLNGNININCPVYLIHGLQDDDVPSSLSTRLAMRITGNDVNVKLVETGDHRMSTPENISLLCGTIAECYSNYLEHTKG